MLYQHSFGADVKKEAPLALPKRRVNSFVQGLQAQLDPGAQATFPTICLFFQVLLFCLQTFLFRQDFPKVTADFLSSNLASLGQRLPFPQEFQWKSQISSQVTLIMIDRAQCVCLRIRPGPKELQTIGGEWGKYGSGGLADKAQEIPITVLHRHRRRAQLTAALVCES